MRNCQQFRLLSSMLRRVCSQCLWHLLHGNRILSGLSTSNRALLGVHSQLLPQHQPDMHTHALEQLSLCQFIRTVHPMRPRLCIGEQHVLPCDSLLFQPLNIIIRVSTVHPGLLLVQQDLLQDSKRLSECGQ